MDDRRRTRRAGHPVPLLVLVATLVAVPGLLTSMGTSSAASPAPPALDRFLGVVAKLTPASSRTVILAAGVTPGLVSYRAGYALYPRVVRAAFATDYSHAPSAPATTWPALRRLARHVGAGYVLLWQLPVAPHGRVLVTTSGGALVQVTP